MRVPIPNSCVEKSKFILFLFLFEIFHVQDGIYLPYENVLNYESFAVRLGEDGIPDMIKILRVIVLIHANKFKWDTCRTNDTNTTSLS